MVKFFKKPETLRNAKILRVIFFAVRGFKQDRCDLRASSLTLFTLLSIVPVMAMAFGIAKGFGFQEFLEKRILDIFAGQEEVIQKVLAFSGNLLEKTKGGLMAVLGVILLFYALIRLVGHIENAFNKIFWIKKDRDLIRKFTDYIAISITAGILVIFSSSANIFITAYLAKFLTHLSLPANIEKLISIGFNIFPFLPIWILFIFFYLFVPNRRIDIKAALAGGMIAGSIFQIIQMAYLEFQVGVSNYNAIYGSFAALPLFLIWLQTSWAVVLFGTEIAFSWENTEALEAQDMEYTNISIRTRKLIILRLVHFCVKNFAAGKPAASDADLAARIKLPLKIVKLLLSKLVESGILVEVTGGNDAVCFAPARDIETLSIYDVLHKFENRGNELTELGKILEFEIFDESLGQFDKACRQCPGEKILRDI